jgi:4,5-dihydroxyphthalate decarboxylase
MLGPPITKASPKPQAASLKPQAVTSEEAPVSPVSRRQFLAAAGVTGGALAGLDAPRAVTATTATTLTLACANYVRFMPIATGDVRPRDVTLTWVRGERNEMLRRATDDPAVDGGESSMAQHVMRLDRGDRSLVAIPVFPLRNFTARDLYARKGAVPAAGALGARRIGIYNWAASGAVWYRHFVRYLGHDTSTISWVVGGVDTPAAVRLPEPPLPNVTPAPEGASLSELLLGRRIDALFAPLPPQKLHPIDGPIVRVFPDFREREQKYFADTRCYPPQHVVLIRRAAWERDPGAGGRLVEAFNASESAFEAAQRLFPYNSPWLIQDVEDAARLMGADYHAHGLEKNRHAVDTFCRGAYEDGLTRRRLTVEDFFAEFLAAARA